jgi:hypothetical protein
MGAKIIDRPASDLQRALPNLSGYSVRNLKYMRGFAAAWPDAMAFHRNALQLETADELGVSREGFRS